MKRLLIAGGGTGGHILAGVAVADAWKQSGGEVLFVGARFGLEEKLIPKANYPLELLTLGSLNRVSFSTKLRTLLQLPTALWRSVRILLKYKPAAVLGVGGYASGPILLMAQVLHKLGIHHARIAIIEQNSVPGFTNRILGRLVQRVFCAFPGMEQAFPHTPTQLTGNPIRSSMQKTQASSRNPFTIFIFGGSQGALGINSLVLDALPLLKDIQSQLRWVHQTGEKDLARVKDGYQKAGVEARIEAFIYNMAEVYAQTSLLICRAGSSTLSEIAAVGRAAILIPFPFASDNHQKKNAEIFVNAGAAKLLNQSQATGKDLANLIREFVANPNALTPMEIKVTQFYKPDAVKDIFTWLSQ